MRELGEPVLGGRCPLTSPLFCPPPPNVCGSVRIPEHLYLQTVGRGAEPTTQDGSQEPRGTSHYTKLKGEEGTPGSAGLGENMYVILLCHMTSRAARQNSTRTLARGSQSDPTRSPNRVPRIKVVLRLVLKEEKQRSDLSCWPISMV